MFNKGSYVRFRVQVDSKREFEREGVGEMQIITIHHHVLNFGSYGITILCYFIS